MRPFILIDGRLNLCRQISGLSLALIKAHDPYFLLAFRRKECHGCPVADAIDIHLACSQRGGTSATNPYSNRTVAFHITFYKIIPTVETTHSMETGNHSNLGADVREKNNIEATKLLVKTCKNNNIKVGHLYEKRPTETESIGIHSPSSRAFKLSAFTVSS